MQETKNKTEGAGWKPDAPVLTLPSGKPVNPWLVLISLVFGFFMSLLDATIVNIALTDIQKSLKTDLTTVSWVLNAYNLVFAVLLVTMGRLADQFGRKRMFMIGMVLFSFGSLLCALAPTVEFLIAFRVVQAIGAATLNPISLAIILIVFTPEKRGAAIGIWGALAGLAAALGPILGGFLVQTFSWQAIFYVNIPFCVVGLYMVYTFVPETKDPNASRSLDILGFVTMTAGLFCLVLAIIEGNTWGWSSALTLSVLGGSVVGLVLFYVVERIQKQPIFDFGLFKFVSFTAANITMFMFSVGIQGAFLILVLYFINVKGYDQLGSAYALLPLPIAAFFVSAFAGRFSNKINPRYIGIAGMIILAIGMCSLATITVDATYWDVAWRSVLVGIGMGGCFTSFPATALVEIPKPKLGVGSGVFNTARQIGFALGVAILISVFTNQVSGNIPAARDRAIKVVQAETRLPDQVKASIVTGLQNSTSSSQGGGEAFSTSSNQFDLTKLADQIPNGQALKPVLAELNTKIATEYQTGVVSAFTTVWWVAGFVIIIGIIPAFFTRGTVPQAPAQKRDEAASVMVDAF